MDAERFDNRVRGLQFASSRRGVARTFAGLSLSGVLGTLSRFTDAAARKKRKRKKKCKGGKRKCGKQCIPSTSCCSDVDCDDGAECLPNRSCAMICTTEAQCGSGCICSLLTVEMFAHCIVGNLTACDQFPQKCASTAQCPQGQHCQGTGCGPAGATEYRCVPLCSA